MGEDINSSNNSVEHLVNHQIHGNKFPGRKCNKYTPTSDANIAAPKKRTTNMQEKVFLPSINAPFPGSTDSKRPSLHPSPRDKSSSFPPWYTNTILQVPLPTSHPLPHSRAKSPRHPNPSWSPIEFPRPWQSSVNYLWCDIGRLCRCGTELLDRRDVGKSVLAHCELGTVLCLFGGCRGIVLLKGVAVSVPKGQIELAGGNIALR